MRRFLLLLGPVIAIIGSVGLALFGGAIVGVFDVLTVRYVDPPEPLPAALADLQLAALSGIAVAFGLAISCCATVMRDDKQSISAVGKVLYIVAGVLLMVGTLPTLWAIMGAKQSFWIMAESESAPRPESVQEMIQSTAPTIAIGCGIIAVAAAVLFVAGLVGFQTTSMQGNSTRSVLSILAVTGSVLFGVILSFLFIAIWFHSRRLGVMITDSPSAAKASELATHLLGVLNKSLFVFVGLALQGVMQILASIFTPSSRSDASTEDVI